jgi:hypothetical protein
MRSKLGQVRLSSFIKQNKTNYVALLRKRTISTEHLPLVIEVNAYFCVYKGVEWLAQRFPTAVNHGFLDRSRYFFSYVAPQLSSRGHCFLENLAALGIENGVSGSVSRRSAAVKNLCYLATSVFQTCLSLFHLEREDYIWVNFVVCAHAKHFWKTRMLSSWMWCRVALERTYVSRNVSPPSSR